MHTISVYLQHTQRFTTLSAQYPTHTPEGVWFLLLRATACDHPS